VSDNPRTAEVLEAYELLLNDSMALDYCGITGKERKLILNDAEFIRASKKIKAGKYIEEIKDINEIVKSLTIGKSADENSRMGAVDEDPSKVIKLKMQVASMRRDMLSLSSSDKETEESESLNIFFIDISREEFEKMLTVEIHEGEEHSALAGDNGKESPMETAARNREERKSKKNVPAELANNVIEYIDENGDKIREEVV